MSSRIRVAVVGVGNNASTLIQGWARASRDPEAHQGSPKYVGGYSLSQVEWVAAFDVSQEKIGLDLADAIHAKPNNIPLYEQVANTGVRVSAAPLLDGISEDLVPFVPILDVTDETPSVEYIAQLLKERKTDVIVNLVPAGSLDVAHFWAEVALLSNSAFVNATPEPIAQDPAFVERFEQAGLPLLGDDLESQMGATVIHRALLETLRLKGLKSIGTYQMNVGGNMDFRNLMNRGQSKAKSKIRGLMLAAQESEVHVIPATGYFPFLGDHKVAHIRVDAEGWLGTRNTIDVRLEINDSSSAASALSDLIRIAKFELERGTSGLVGDAGFYFKSAVGKSDLAEAYQRRDRYLFDPT